MFLALEYRNLAVEFGLGILHDLEFGEVALVVNLIAILVEVVLILVLGGRLLDLVLDAVLYEGGGGCLLCLFKPCRRNLFIRGNLLR